MLRSMMTNGVIKDSSHDIFDPYKLHNTALSGRYYIEDISKLKNVLSCDFSDFPDELFGILDVSITRKIEDPMAESKKINTLIENMKYPLINKIKERDNIYSLNPTFLYMPLTKVDTNWHEGQPRVDFPEYIKDKLRNEIAATTLIPGGKDPEFIRSGGHELTTWAKKSMDTYYQGITITYTFYANNGNVYKALVKLDDAIISIITDHKYIGDGINKHPLFPRNFPEVRKEVTKAIHGAVLIAENEDGTVYDYFKRWDTTGPQGTKVETEESKRAYNNRKPRLKILFKSVITSENAMRDYLVAVDDIEKDFLTANDKNDKNSIYNFHRDRIITRAAYYLGGISDLGKMVFSQYQTPVISGNHVNDILITGRSDFIENKNAPYLNDVIITRGRHDTIEAIVRRESTNYFYMTEYLNPDPNRIKPFGRNTYGFSMDYNSKNNVPTGIHRGFIFRIEVKGDLLESPIQRFSPAGAWTTFTRKDGAMLRNVPIPRNTFNTYGRESPMKFLNYAIPYLENSKYLTSSYPCVFWYTFPWHNRKFNKEEITKLNNNFNFKYYHAFMNQETPNMKLHEENEWKWWNARSDINQRDASSTSRFLAGLEAYTNPNTLYGFERSSPWIRVLLTNK